MVKMRPKTNKHLYMVLIGLLLFANKTIAQYNLVPNSSFEDYITCPQKLNNYPPPPWYNACKPVSTYSNSCCTDIYASVPYNTVGGFSYQFAKTGGGYIYLDYVNGFTRTYIQVKLKDSLKKNNYYYVEQYVNNPNSQTLACNNLAMLFTNAVIYSDPNRLTFNPIIANAQIVNYGNPIIGDTLNWIKVSGIFKAKGGEQYLTLGNFKDNANTLTKQIVPNGYNAAGYYIDDVSVIPLDSFCLKADAGRDTTIKVGDSVFIGSYTNGIDTLMWLENGTIKKDSTRPGFWFKPTATGTSFYVLQQTVNGCYSADTVYINAVLPLNFINYNVISNAVRNLEKSIQNIWTTASEVNVNYFNIQRSANGKDFVTIGKVKALNNSYNEYSYTDELKTKDQYPKTLYYRIESVDNDGKVTYSVIRNVELGMKNGVSVYPNPAKDYINITSNRNIQSIEITNYLGQTIHFKNNINRTSHIINLTSLTKGIYFIKVLNCNTGNLSVQKVMLQ